MTKVVTLDFYDLAGGQVDADLASEILISCLDALTRAEIAVNAAPTRENCLAETRALNVLFDVCLQLGMPFDEPSITEWAGKQACHALVAA
jgi:hypothetical protein